MGGVYFHDLLVATDGPVGPGLCLRAKMHRRLVPQPLEPGLVNVGGEQVRIGYIEGIQWNTIGVDIDLLG